MTRTDLAILLYLGVAWGGAFLFLRIAAPQVGPLWAAEIRIGLGAIILLAVAGPRAWRAIRGRALEAAFVGATFSAIPFGLFAFALLTLPAGMGSLLNAATPIFTAMVSAAWLGQRLGVRALVGMGVGVVAVLVLVGWSPLPAETGTLIAVGAALLAPLSYAIGGTFIRRRLPDVGGLELATGQLTFGALLLLPAALISGPPGTPSLDGMLSLLAIGVFSTALAWPLYFRVMSHTTPTAASTVTFIVPAFGIAWGALALGEPIGPELVIGFAMVVVSLVLVLGLPVPGLDALRSRLARDTHRPMPRATPAS